MSNVTDLDSRRPHVHEPQKCHNCGHEQVSVHLADARREWWECGKCGEIACKAVNPHSATEPQ